MQYFEKLQGLAFHTCKIKTYTVQSFHSALKYLCVITASASNISGVESGIVSLDFFVFIHFLIYC